MCWVNLLIIKENDCLKKINFEMFVLNNFLDEKERKC